MSARSGGTSLLGVAERSNSKRDPSTTVGMTGRPEKPERSGESLPLAMYNPSAISIMIYHIYIMASASGVLYTGITSHLEARVAQHKQKLFAGFSAQYNTTKLVYFEPFSDVRNAIAREEQLKRWRREKKVFLIERANPTWRDLSADFPC